MKVQLPVRWSDRAGTKGDDILKRLLDREDEDSEEEIEYIYGNVVMDVKDIRAYNDLDENHCILRTYFNDSYCIALGIEDLKNVMAELTGSSVTIVKKVEAKKQKPGKRKTDDDDITL